MRNPLEVVARGCRVRSVVHGDEGGSGRRASPACGAWAPKARQGLLHLAQRGQERLGCLPRAWVGLEHGAESLAWSSCGGAGTEFGAWPMEGSSGRPGSTDRVLGVLRSRTEGQGGPVLYDGEQLLKKPCTCGGDSRGESRRGRGGDRGQRVRGASWARGGAAVRLRWGWGVAERRGRGGAGCSAPAARRGMDAGVVVVATM